MMTTVKSFLVMGLLSCAIGCSTTGGSDTASTAASTDSTIEPFDVTVLSGYPASAGVPGISTWDARVVGNAAGEISMVMTGGDLDGLLQYSVQWIFSDSKNPEAAHDIQIFVSAQDGTSVAGELDEATRAAIATDFQGIADQLKAASLATDEGLGTQSITANLKRCWLPILGSAVSIVTTALTAVAVIDTCTAASVATFGVGAYTCFSIGGGALVSLVGITGLELNAVRECAKHAGS